MSIDKAVLHGELDELQKQFVETLERAIAKYGARSLSDDEKRRCLIRCPDHFVGRLCDIRHPNEFNRVDVRDGHFPDQRIILVLESPHIDEYFKDENGYWRVLGPAVGCSGCRIRRHLLQKLSTETGLKSINDKYELVLVNAVQFQCSLGRRINGKMAEAKINRNVKEFVMREMLKEGTLGRADFCSRFRELLRPRGCLTVNACTSRSSKVVQSIMTDIVGGEVLKFTHPASWC